MSFVLLLVVVASGATRLAPARGRAQWKTPWEYTGPRGSEHWGALDPAYTLCNSGTEQSPIDITGARHVDLPPLELLNHLAPLDHVVNNGHTIRVNYPQGSGDVLTAGDKRYQLTQFHFHRPSEHLVNGKRYAMELHKYSGSVTAPPCTEGVVWYVLKTPVEVSTAQIAAFAKLYPNDARPPMPLNSRVIGESR